MDISHKYNLRRQLKALVIVLLVSIITTLHFLTSTDRMYLHEIYQRSYYIPIVLAGFWFELWGGVATAIGLSGVYIIHILRDWGHSPEYSFQQYAASRSRHNLRIPSARFIYSC